MKNNEQIRDEISLRAYLKWREAGSPDGDGTQFWLAAESEVTAEITKFKNTKIKQEKTSQLHPQNPNQDTRNDESTWMSRLRRFWLGNVNP